MPLNPSHLNIRRPYVHWSHQSIKPMFVRPLHYTTSNILGRQIGTKNPKSLPHYCICTSDACTGNPWKTVDPPTIWAQADPQPKNPKRFTHTLSARTEACTYFHIPPHTQCVRHAQHILFNAIHCIAFPHKTAP